MLRFYADAAAILFHTGFLIAVPLASAGNWGTLEGGLLLAMEGAALLAHCYYVRAYYRDPTFETRVNVIKWGEYAFSATVGGLAVLASAGEDTYPWQVPVVIAALGVSEQATGYTLDVHVGEGEQAQLKDYVIWASAAAGQICEFAVVGSYTGFTLPYAMYVVFWSLYGGWAFFILWGYTTNLDVRETGYSLLSTFAKLSVFIASGLALT